MNDDSTSSNHSQLPIKKIDLRLRNLHWLNRAKINTFLILESNNIRHPNYVAKNWQIQNDSVRDTSRHSSSRCRFWVPITCERWNLASLRFGRHRPETSRSFAWRKSEKNPCKHTKQSLKTTSIVKFHPSSIHYSLTMTWVTHNEDSTTHN